MNPNFIIYDFKHSRFGYPHVEPLCFICATKAAMLPTKPTESIRPRILGDDLSKKCERCDREMNYLEARE